MKTKWQLSILLGLALALNGCYFTSQNPLPKTEFDQALAGAWKTIPEKDDDKSERDYLFFMEDSQGYFQIIVMKNNYQYEELYRGFCSQVNNEKYLNVKPIKMGNEMQPPEIEQNYYWVHYKIRDQKYLEMALLNEDIFKQAIKQGKLKGTLTGKTEDVNLTETTENLAAFLSQQPLAQLLADKLTRSERTRELPPAPGR